MTNPVDARRLVDLSHPIGTGMRVHPGDPEVGVVPALTVSADGVNVLRLRLGSQSGTHVDAAAAGHDVRVALLPLHLRGADGAPVRAVATIDEPSVRHQLRTLPRSGTTSGH